MNIDFIKWMCDKADGFEWTVYDYGEFVRATGIRINETVMPWSDNWVDIYYPLLLQRAIEGVNRDAKKIYSPTIEIYEAGISATANNALRFFRWGSSSIDQAKEAALMCIYEQEKLS